MEKPESVGESWSLTKHIYLYIPLCKFSAKDVGRVACRWVYKDIYRYITSTMLLIVVVVASVSPMATLYFSVQQVYAQTTGVICDGYIIERGNFDADPDDEVRINGTVYNNGSTITLNTSLGIKTYTILIATSSYTLGTPGNDLIIGTNEDDDIYGKEGDDFIVGFGGNDYLYGDYIDGTPGNDTIRGGDDILCGNDGDDRLYGDSIYGYAGNDTITGGNDILYGGAGNDLLYGDYIDGGYGGYDSVVGGDDVINALDDVQGNDQIDGDYIRNAENVTLGSKDICAGDPDNQQNCEYSISLSITPLSVGLPVTINDRYKQPNKYNWV